MIVPCLVVTGRGVYRGEVDLAQVQFLGGLLLRSVKHEL